MSIFKRSLIAIAGILGVIGPANASMITDRVDFTIDLSPLTGNPLAYVYPVTGSFNITFDPSISYTTPTYTGISLNNLNIDPGLGPLNFETIAGFGIQVGTVAGGSTASVYGFSTAFAIEIADVMTTNPRLLAFGYDNGQNIYLANVGIVNITQLPLPAGLPLFAAALGAWGLFSARKRVIA